MSTASPNYPVLELRVALTAGDYERSIEAGQRNSGQVWFALQVPDLKAAMERLLSHGATLVHPPSVTPWGDYNVRLEDPMACKLDQLIGRGRFRFIGLPLKIRGGTGSPVRAVAVFER